jgi:tyrosine-specific transport protein
MALALKRKENVLGATLLVSGCCIGAGMIGLPVLSAVAGFFPSFVAMLFAYFFTTATGLLLLEATLWFDKQVNLLSIAQFALGRAGKLITGALFLFLFYCIFVAYMDGGGQLFAGALSSLFHTPVSREMGIVACATFVGAITYAGTRMVDGINRGLMVGLIASYCILVILGLPSVNLANLLYVDWTASVATIPVLLVCFGYQNLVPSLTHYLKKNVRALRFSIIVGNFLPLLLYLLWNFVILGLLPSGNFSHAGKSDMVSGLLESATHSSGVLFFVKAFSFFALLTSFLAIAISFVDFLKDGFQIKNPKKLHEGLIYALVLVPPMIFSLFYPHVFLQALGLAGGFADVLLFGALPPLVVWIGRYKLQAKGSYQVGGGKWLLGSIFFLSLGLLGLRFI